MPSIPEENAGWRFWRRKARSLDLSGSREGSITAEAWIWHMNMNTTAKNESPVHYAEWRASDSIWERTGSSSSDKRFRQEAASAISSSPLNTASTVWDCGSKLYDTFELVSFSNRLDRSLFGVPDLDALNFHHVQSPFHHARVLRTLSSPSIRSPDQISSYTTATAAAPTAQINNCHELSASCYLNPSCHHVDSISHAPSSSVVHGLDVSTITKSKSSCVSQAFFAKWLTKVVKMASFQGHMCFKANLELEETLTKPRISRIKGDEGGGMSIEQERPAWQWEWEHEWSRMYKEKEKEDPKHLHYHHHHHHHHHFLHHQSNHSGTCVAESQPQPLNEH